ncbi:alpha/beta fold hydrolase [Marmoricola sp. RAF53]|uniref:alpha/beta fold hydrolase n=1 Tax=Marmoricola sp. RAF53 TaxID=3233059 RepID=UPI003F9E90A5
MAPTFVKRASVRSADGTRLSVFEAGNPDGPVVVAVHGYPDNHAVWDGIAAELGDTHRVIAYDVRGAGTSDQPAGRAAYRMERLAEDFRAVIDDVSPDTPVHLLAHDWGSIQSWGPVTDPAFTDRIASFTSISGPSMDYAGVWLRDRGHVGASVRQLLKSYYMAAFQIPRLPERIVATDFVARGITRVEMLGRADAKTAEPVDRGIADRTNGINLYRANVFGRLLRPHPEPTLVPTLVLVPVDDPFATPRVSAEAPVPFVEALTVTEIPGSHWVVTARPDLVAMHVREYVAAHQPAPAVPAGRGKRARR